MILHHCTYDQYGNLWGEYNGLLILCEPHGDTWGDMPMDSDNCPHCGRPRKRKAAYQILQCEYSPCDAYHLPDSI